MGITMGTQWNSVVVTAVSRGALEHLLLPHTPREGVSLHPRDGIGGECLRVLPERVQEALRLRGQHAAAVCEDFLRVAIGLLRRNDRHSRRPIGGQSEGNRRAVEG